MTPLARKQLIALIAANGPDLADDPRRLRALLSDECPGLKAEVNVLVAAAEHRIPRELLNSSSHLPWNVLSGRLVQRLTEEGMIKESAARWAVDSWGIALGRISEAALPRPPKAEPIPITVVPISTPARPPAKPPRPAPKRPITVTVDERWIAAETLARSAGRLMILTGTFYLAVLFGCVALAFYYAKAPTQDELIGGSICVGVQLLGFLPILLGGIRLRRLRSRWLVVLGAASAFVVSILAALPSIVLVIILFSNDRTFDQTLYFKQAAATLVSCMVCLTGFATAVQTLSVLTNARVAALFDRRR